MIDISGLDNSSQFPRQDKERGWIRCHLNLTSK